jgi:hypothetical protein
MLSESEVVVPELVDETAVDAAKCRFCGKPIPPSKRVTRPKEFCNGPCRAMARVVQRRENAKDAVDLLLLQAKDAEQMASALSDFARRSRMIATVVANLVDKPRKAKQ